MPVPRPKNRNILAVKLKALMEDHQMTQRTLASASGVSQRQISNILRGENSPSVEIADALAKPFGLAGWQLIAPIPVDKALVGALNRLISAYTGSQDLRTYLDLVVDRELRTLPRLPPSQS